MHNPVRAAFFNAGLPDSEKAALQFMAVMIHFKY
jgi:hypothetical protein